MEALQATMAALAGHVQNITQKLDRLTDNVSILADQVTEVNNRVPVEQAQVANPAGDDSSSGGSSSATSAQLATVRMRPKELRQFAKCTMGASHADWIAQTLALVTEWNEDAAEILTNPGRSLHAEGYFEISPDDIELNSVLFHKLNASASGKARKVLGIAMRAATKDATLSYDNGLMPDQARALQHSAHIAWKALSDVDTDFAQKYLDLLTDTKAKGMPLILAHLNLMDDYFQQYSGCVGPDLVRAEQGMLVDKLILSFPREMATAISNAQLPLKARERTWEDTFDLATRWARNWHRLARYSGQPYNNSMRKPPLSRQRGRGKGNSWQRAIMPAANQVESDWHSQDESADFGEDSYVLEFCD